MLQPASAMSRSGQVAPPASHSLSSPAVLLGLSAVALVIAAVVVTVFELANWDKVSPGVTALGVSVGGLSRADAVARLTPSVQQLLDRPLDIHGADLTWHTTARDLGLRLDPDELVGAAYAVGRTGSPVDRLGGER